MSSSACNLLPLQIREAQALHFLQHRYTPSQIHELVQESLDDRPDLPDPHASQDLHAWHEEQWKRLRDAVNKTE